MKHLEQKLFYFLFDRWAMRTQHKINMPNGVLCLTKHYGLVVKHYTGKVESIDA